MQESQIRLKPSTLNMKRSKAAAFVILSFILLTGVTRAGLAIKLGEPKTYGQKTLVRLEMQNSFTNKIESARGVLFLLDDSGKVLGQETRWIIGGTKDRPALAPGERTSFTFVLLSKAPFTKTKVTITRLVLEGGKLADVNKDVQIESAPSDRPRSPSG